MARLEIPKQRIVIIIPEELFPFFPDKQVVGIKIGQYTKNQRGGVEGGGFLSFSSPESLSRMHKPPAFERKISRECYRSLFSFLLSSPRDSSYKFEKDGAERIHRTGDKDPERATFPPPPSQICRNGIILKGDG